MKKPIVFIIVSAIILVLVAFAPYPSKTTKTMSGVVTYSDGNAEEFTASVTIQENRFLFFSNRYVVKVEMPSLFIHNSTIKLSFKGGEKYSPEGNIIATGEAVFDSSQNGYVSGGTLFISKNFEMLEIDSLGITGFKNAKITLKGE
ncbi:MAG: hypothetical protein HUJ69_07960 [Lachnospiraceae bacterium]|nr:hypothetical protein [Lachnospiraceae bacterium]